MRANVAQRAHGDGAARRHGGNELGVAPRPRLGKGGRCAVSTMIDEGMRPLRPIGRFRAHCRRPTGHNMPSQAAPPHTHANDPNVL